jgi:RNA polymerase sigma-70 factor (ECF subfamily)
MKPRSITWPIALPQAPAATAPELVMDDEAFAAFYQRNARPLWAYLARVSGNATMADDFLQESFVRFLSSQTRPDGEVACRHYLFAIATNLMRDHWRKAPMAAIDDVAPAALPSAEPPDAETIGQLALLSSAFPRLRARERQLLWLAYAEGNTHKEIAEITGLSSPSIRIMLFRARRKLARLLRQRITTGGEQ